MKITKKLYPYYLVLPALLIYVILFVLPTIIGLFYSFTDWRLDRTAIHFNGWANFHTIFSDETLILALRNTLIFAIVTVIGKNLIGLLLAVVLNMKLKTRNGLR
ncbi:sugar ABC transporter permease, partial [Gorillibacterium massiliense]|uniref:carbohydrate ABC transporter permease n=1 Tax=Gorillibacterium massiliense TaxID=1280390 RepID=UPI0005941452